jgi:hypothetical protein
MGEVTKAQSILGTNKEGRFSSMMVENLPPKDDQGALRGEKF